MFSIMTDHADWECDNLENQEPVLVDQMTGLDQAMKELKELSCMEEPVNKLYGIYSDLELQHRILHQMTVGLKETVFRYRNCEDRICDNRELREIVFYRRRKNGW